MKALSTWAFSAVLCSSLPAYQAACAQSFEPHRVPTAHAGTGIRTGDVLAPVPATAPVIGNHRGGPGNGGSNLGISILADVALGRVMLGQQALTLDLRATSPGSFSDHATLAGYILERERCFHLHEMP